MASPADPSAGPSQPPPGPRATGVRSNILTALESDKDLLDTINEFRRLYQNVVTQDLATDSLSEDALSDDHIKSVLLTWINGSQSLTEQIVQVEYLRDDQRMILPGAIGMDPFNPDRSFVANHATLMDRYLRAAALTWAEICMLVELNVGKDATIEAVNAKTPVATPAAANFWLTDAFFDAGDEYEQYYDNREVIFARFSAWLQFNCDIRDVGALFRENMTMSDTAWREILPPERLKSKLKPLTVRSIAALNLAPCANFALGSWMRAYAMSAGVLPDKSSSTVREYKFKVGQAPSAALQEVARFESTHKVQFRSLCMNAVAMFGLFHLAKDHTYKTNDANMDRIARSYANTLRTMANANLQEMINNNIEVVVRTAAHPFGLAQTYAVARWMHARNMLASPLMLRMNATPPPVQRVMICLAAVGEWGNTPAGRALTQTYEDQIKLLHEQSELIMTDPTAYSGLYRLYGHNVMKKISPDADIAANVMLPMIYGYSQVMHVSEGDKKDGIALSLSLQNVARTQVVAAKTFESQWDNYLRNLEEKGLLQFAAETVAANMADRQMSGE